MTPGRIAAGIRFAADNGAHVINLSFEFPSDITRSQIPNILNAIRHARRKGTLVVGASGNAAAAAVAYPARSSDVLSVGATTQHGCQADYSNEGADLDIVAPGGGVDAALEGDPLCRPLEAPGLDIFQMTFTSSPRRFGLPDGYIGTSMAAPHASGHRRPGHRVGRPRPEAVTPARSSAGSSSRRRTSARPARTRTTGGAASTRRARERPGDSGHLSVAGERLTTPRARVCG